MYGVNYVRVILYLLASLLVSLVGWLLVAPIAYLMPRRADWVAVIGRQDGLFLDNSKYFFLQAGVMEPSVCFVYITERANVEKMVKECGGHVLRYPSLKGCFFLLRCAAVVVDDVSWYRRFRFFCLIGAQTIQLWHGVGFKWIEAKLWENQVGKFKWLSYPIVRKFRIAAYKITGRRIRYSTVLCTSDFYRENVFKPAFIARSFIVAGYPRNDFSQVLSGRDMNLAWCNVDPHVRRNLDQWHANGKRVVMVAPTFRDSDNPPLELDRATLKKIDDFAENNKIEFIFKFHPSEKSISGVLGKHFHVCGRDSDIYPLFPYLSALITDYSSVSTDFLLIDKPLFFLLPENDDYLEKNQKLQFDPFTMMPGQIFSNWNLLLNSLLNEWEEDSYKVERAVLCNEAFDGLRQSESVPRLIEMMKENGWINGK